MISMWESTSKTYWTNCSRARPTTTAFCPTFWKQRHPEAVRAYRVEERRDKADRKQLSAARRRLAARDRR